jgi:hypothetical protein
VTALLSEFASDRELWNQRAGLRQHNQMLILNFPGNAPDERSGPRKLRNEPGS